jgi:hypothetical protein
MNRAGLSLQNLGWLPAVLALLALASFIAVRGFRRTPALTRSPLALGLKLGGFALLALALLEPSWSRARARPGANFFLLLADGSRSLRLHDRGQATSRGEAQRALLTGNPTWLAPLAEIYQLRRYGFDTRLERLTDFAGQRFDGDSSNLGSALRTLSERYRGAPVAGVLLFTDGNATDLTSTPDLKGMPPIYPVVTDPQGADRQAPVDVALVNVRASQTLFEDAPVTIDAKVETSGQRGRPLDVELRDGKGQVVARQRLTPTGDPQTLPVRFQVRPDAPGLVPYRVTVNGGRDEATPLNNSRLLLVERPHGGSRILYVGGRPSWEYKFLRRALENDRQLQLTALVRMAPREPKFAFLTRRGETQNPLYRGFGVSADDAERFDEPVLVRLGTKDDKELRAGFPKAAEELFEFQALIIDDMEAAFFTADQKALIERFVTERGGGLLMLGGPGSFRQGGYARTPIGELLPLHLDRAAEGQTGAPPPVRLSLSREGWLEAWTRLRDNEAGERARLEAMPAFQVLSRTGAMKPAATVLATAEATAKPGGGVAGAAAGSYPLLVAQRAGEGRTAAITVGDLWRWGLRRSPGEADDLAKFWRQTLRFLVSDVPAAITVTLEPNAAEPNALTVRVRARGRDFRPAEGATVQVEAQSPTGERQQLAVEPGDVEPGVHEATYRPTGTGLHRLTARVTGSDGQKLGEAEAGLPVDLLADEHRSVRPNLALLETLARGTGGALVAASDLPAFTRALRDRPAPVSDLETRPLWHSWLVLLAALGCFAGEWALRRTRGLP